MQWHNGIPEPSWDEQLFAQDGHFLQSSHWAAFQAALGRDVFYATGNGWRCLAILETARTGFRLYCPYGPLATDKRAFKAALDALKDLARRKHALFVRMEPLVPLTRKQLSALPLKSALKDIQQRQTWRQDLTKTDDQLLADMTATNRNLFRNFVKKDLAIRSSDNPADMRHFIAMMREVATNNRILQHSDLYYHTMAKTLLARGAAKIYVTEHAGKPVAAAFFFDSPSTRYYAHAAAYRSARNLNPGTILVARAMFDAKQQDQHLFDFMGVAPKDAKPDHRWAGFTKFKQSFGGSYHQYLGTWELPTHPFYRLYRGVYQLKKKLS